jgi:hypothetical protein
VIQAQGRTPAGDHPGAVARRRVARQMEVAPHRAEGPTRGRAKTRSPSTMIHTSFSSVVASAFAPATAFDHPGIHRQAL